MNLAAEMTAYYEKEREERGLNSVREEVILPERSTRPMCPPHTSKPSVAHQKTASETFSFVSNFCQYMSIQRFEKQHVPTCIKLRLYGLQTYWQTDVDLIKWPTGVDRMTEYLLRNLRHHSFELSAPSFGLSNARFHVTVSDIYLKSVCSGNMFKKDCPSTTNFSDESFTNQMIGLLYYTELLGEAKDPELQSNLRKICRGESITHASPPIILKCWITGVDEIGEVAGFPMEKFFLWGEFVNTIDEESAKRINKLKEDVFSSAWPNYSLLQGNRVLHIDDEPMSKFTSTGVSYEATVRPIYGSFLDALIVKISLLCGGPNYFEVLQIVSEFVHDDDVWAHSHYSSSKCRDFSRTYDFQNRLRERFEGIGSLCKNESKEVLKVQLKNEEHWKSFEGDYSEDDESSDEFSDGWAPMDPDAASLMDVEE